MSNTEFELTWVMSDSEIDDADLPDTLLIKETGEPVVIWLGGNWEYESENPESNLFIYRMRDGTYKHQKDMVEGDVRRLVEVDTYWDKNHWTCLTLNPEEKMILTLRGKQHE